MTLNEVEKVLDIEQFRSEFTWRGFNPETANLSIYGAVKLITEHGLSMEEATREMIQSYHHTAITPADRLADALYRLETKGFAGLDIRKTHRYVGTYRHLDEWETVAKYRQIAHTTDEPEDFYDSAKTELFVWVKPLSRREKLPKNEVMKEAIFSQYNSVGCACSHDCCGCLSTYVTSVQLLGSTPDGKNATYRVLLSSSRNY